MANIDIKTIKQRFGIIGFNPELERAIRIAVQVAPTDLSVLVTGESGVGKENFPKIIHEFSRRKHGPYFAVNCGAIPEGTIDSELFGHVKGAFTGATEDHKGYFEVANKGTIFLDEVGDLPIATQVRLLRVLETGEFMKVGSAQVQKTDVRVISATNVNLANSIANGKFREDLFYRLNTVPISVPSLRQRKEDIYPLFIYFASECAEKYNFPQINLTDGAKEALANYSWPGNIRQLKNVTEQMSLIEPQRLINEETLSHYLISPTASRLPVLAHSENHIDNPFEREIIFNLLADMKREVTELRELVKHIINGDIKPTQLQQDFQQIHNINSTRLINLQQDGTTITYPAADEENNQYWDSEIVSESNASTKINNVSEEDNDTSLSLEDHEKDLIIKALLRNGNKRAAAAKELGISERTLYRKIKELEI